MDITNFESQFQKYLAQIEEAKAQKKHHDHLRSIFISFLSQAFNVQHEEFELEKGIKIAKVKGFIDALYQDIVFEFKRDLNTEREKGKEELTTYLQSLTDGNYFGILTDGLLFEIYFLRENELAQIDSIFLKAKTVTPEGAFSWFDHFLFSVKELVPSSEDMVRRFGPKSPVFISSSQKLKNIFNQFKDTPSVKVKFEEWDKLLSKVYGSSIGSSELFIRHSYLSLLVKIIGYMVLFKEKPKDKSEFFAILDGEAFSRRGFKNLAETDFFTWVLSVPLQNEIGNLLSGLIQHISVYDLSKINEDLLKELYQQLIDPETRHDLGEFYTPDWLAELTLKEANWGKGKSLLDPACGSGTFLFIAIRMLREQGLHSAELIEKARDDIQGIDVHPIAVTIAKINYVLALAPELIGYKGTITIPIYMADSLMKREKTYYGKETFLVEVSKTERFEIPEDTTLNPESLDKNIDEMRTYAGKPSKEAASGFEAYLKKQGCDDKSVQLWLLNLQLMAKLVQEKRDTIWAFLLKNYYRPVFLWKSFTLVAGNPPWLAYRYIRDPDYQDRIKKRILEYKLLNPDNIKLFTHMDTSTIFFAYCSFMYLRDGETIAFVMPRSVFTGAKQHANFRDVLAGKMPAFWDTKLRKFIDLEKIKVTETPTKGVFNVPACVIIARKNYKEDRPIQKIDINGTLSKKNFSFQEAYSYLTIKHQRISPEKLFLPAPQKSYYLEYFKEGATMVPRCFWFVQPAAGQGLAVINYSRPYLKTSAEVEKHGKEPWKNIKISEEVEADFLYVTLLGKHLLPFGYIKLDLVVLPLEISAMGMRMLNSQIALRDGYSGLHNWLSQVEKQWGKEKKIGSIMNPYTRINYRRLLTSQYPSGYYNVLYGSAGTHVASCVINTIVGNLKCEQFSAHGFFAESETYCYQTKNSKEVYYLCALLNSNHVDESIKPYQTKGAWGERHIHRRPFEVLPIPKFNPQDENHLKLAKLSEECHIKVSQLSLKDKSIGILRNEVRTSLSSELSQIDELVKIALGKITEF